MSRQIQIRRGTKTQHASFTGAIGEVTMDTTNNTLRVHDGKTVGGSEMLSRDGFYSHITNCITEIPQDIKLELNNGILTLKAGSKVHLACGNLGDSNVIESDVFTSQTSDGKYMVIRTSTSALYMANIDMCLSGTIANRPTLLERGAGLYFATDENKMYLTGDKGATWYSGEAYSLPLGIVTVSNGAISSIDQIFNGFGYIGSTAFVLPGVTGLAPDGRNEDGSLKYTQITTTEIITYTRTENGGRFIGCLTGSKTLDNGYISYVVSETQPTTNFVLWYKPSANKLYTVINGVATPDTRLVVWNEIRDIAQPYNITSFEPKSAFHAVDYNDIGFIAHQAMPSDRYMDLTLPASGGSVVAPSDGWVSVSKNAGAQYTQIVLTTENYISTQSRAGTNVSAPVNCIIPVKQGSVVTVEYSASGSTNYFKFIYANGAK